MISKELRKTLNDAGEKLSLTLPEFHGKISFNFYNGKYVHSNVEQSIKNNNLKQGVKE